MVAEFVLDVTSMNSSGSESRVLQVLLELLPVGVAIAHDPQCRQITLNSAASRMLGRELQPDELPLYAAVETAAAVRDIKVELLRRDGSMLHVNLNASPIRDDAGTITGAIGVLVDVRAEADSRAEQFRELALALADAEARERKRLARLLHDDFQQLISAAKLRAGILRRATHDQDLQAAAKQVEQLLEAAMAASRSLTNELNPPVLFEGGLTAAIEAMARSLQQQHALKLVTCCDPRADPEAEQVRVLLFEAVRELLHNVIRHAGASEASIATGLSVAGQIEISVVDNGRGFDPLKLTVDPNRDTRPFGLMEISERLRWLGGTMHIHSVIGTGTTVQLAVPAILRANCAPAVTQTPLPVSQRRKQADSHGNGSGPARILVADDHAMFREGLISLLRHEPAFDVVGEAADGQQAVTLARTLKPDILLVDVTMPKMSGLEVTAQLSREMPCLRIVGLSMHEPTDMAASMQNAGAVAYLSKDQPSEALLEMLRKLA